VRQEGRDGPSAAGLSQESTACLPGETLVPVQRGIR